VIAEPIVFVCRSHSLGCLQRQGFLDGMLMGQAASRSLAKIRWMWSIMFLPFFGSSTFNAVFKRSSATSPVFKTHSLLEGRPVYRVRDFHASNLDIAIANIRPNYSKIIYLLWSCGWTQAQTGCL